MMSVDEMIEECGFDDWGRCPADKLRVRSEVRDMCAAGRCHMYGHNWACPPACGEIEEFAEAIAARKECYVVQTVADLEDEFDVESMMEAEQRQKQRMFELADKLRAADCDVLVLTSGACTLCPKCSYPDEPCRFPDKRFVSMESAGLMVSEACATAGVDYTHGNGTMTYTGAVLV